jgi:mono/diheme cytochrome c family protein
MKLTMICAALILFASADARAQGDSKALYMSKCATCHGPDGMAKTAMGKKLKVQDAQTASGKMSADEMVKIVADGKSPGMMGYSKQFNAEQVKGVVDYYRSLGK